MSVFIYKGCASNLQTIKCPAEATLDHPFNISCGNHSVMSEAITYVLSYHNSTLVHTPLAPYESLLKFTVNINTQNVIDGHSILAKRITTTCCLNISTSCNGSLCSELCNSTISRE